MIFIAHRGLFNGPDVNLENRPEQIELALSKGYDCEIDVWKEKDQWYLGHDYPEYKIDKKFLFQDGLWLHCKNLSALHELSFNNDELNYFWHENDKFTLTSQHYIWTYPGNHLTSNSIAVQPEAQEHWWEWTLSCKDISGVCTKYVEKFIKEVGTLPVRSTEELQASI